MQLEKSWQWLLLLYGSGNLKPPAGMGSAGTPVMLQPLFVPAPKFAW
jgi:hypothetical protein